MVFLWNTSFRQYNISSSGIINETFLFNLFTNILLLGSSCKIFTYNFTLQHLPVDFILLPLTTSQDPLIFFCIYAWNWPSVITIYDEKSLFKCCTAFAGSYSRGRWVGRGSPCPTEMKFAKNRKHHFWCYTLNCSPKDFSVTSLQLLY